MSGQTASYRRRRSVLAQWLHDRFDDVDPEGEGKRYTDAADLLKWLSANGFRIAEDG